MRMRYKQIASLIFLSVLLTSCGEVGKPDFAMMGGGSKKWETLVKDAQDAQAKGKIDEAEKLYKEAIDVCSKKYGEKAAQTGTCVGYLAGMYMARQDWKVAYNEYKQWKAIMQEVEPDGEQMKIIDQDLKKIKAKMIQYNLVPDEVLKKRAEKRAAEEEKQKDATKKSK
ncbi:tetratricopeptide repeat protein [Candidatus Obscuribacterales bacterium]|nr:tetratricopeptide repeat protein [Candidatus Obscuribacterales bacterium]MBX3137132.1 tetratricopeptide repeat protein [Candidatus Obscuribacterales bacterium]MBX3149149.1 tetratricopeptide repeat protein [Candidatus Obscuribacterales bacterium]